MGSKAMLARAWKARPQLLCRSALLGYCYLNLVDLIEGFLTALVCLSVWASGSGWSCKCRTPGEAEKPPPDRMLNCTQSGYTTESERSVLYCVLFSRTILSWLDVVVVPLCTSTIYNVGVAIPANHEQRWRIIRRRRSVVMVQVGVAKGTATLLCFWSSDLFNLFHMAHADPLD
jgi:hypothetical protein